MSDDIAISVRNLTVEFDLASYRYDSFKEFVLHGFGKKNVGRKLRALDNINLDIRKGDSVALIGHNGCGKSTLLKVIAGVIIAPGADLRVAGRVAPLIELGAGFDGELSGRENIRLSCMLMGLSAADIEARTDAIIRFAELKDFIDVPLKNYSSGMKARLGFSCATAVDPDILLVDEVLAVGDSNFARKCYERIHGLKKQGTTVVLVSHDTSVVRNFCDRGFVFYEGKQIFQGNVADACQKHDEVMDQRYLANLSEAERAEALRLRSLQENVVKQLTGQLGAIPSITSAFRVIQDEEPVGVVDTARPFRLEFDLIVGNPELFGESVSVGIGINTLNDVRIGGCNNIQQMVPFPIDEVRRRSHVNVIFDFPQGMRQLSTGVYKLILGIHDHAITRNIDTREVGRLTVSNSHVGPNLDTDIVHIPDYVAPIAFRFD
jgi:ABC-type polysaccharide/polyol phosphate transport system ATPase subunit